MQVGTSKGVKQVEPALKAIPAKTQGVMTVMQGLVKPIGVHLKNAATLTLMDAGVALMDIAHRYSDYEVVGAWPRLEVCTRHGVTADSEPRNLTPVW